MVTGGYRLYSEVQIVTIEVVVTGSVQLKMTGTALM